MELYLCAILDNKANAYTRHVVVRHPAMAQRWFADQCSNPLLPNNELITAPDEFDLYVLAVTDDATGAVTPVNPPRLVDQGAAHAQRRA